ncbi:MAG: PTS sugar transporter subunit IIC, partial [Clostridiales bacterium]|nr:PTS sugar transporter subunit IIC [Clostridiales bacterium]
SAITGPIATVVFRLEQNGPAVASGMGTCGLGGPIGVYSGWISDIAAGTKAAVTSTDWLGLVLVCFVLPALISYLLGLAARKIGWIREGDLKLS